MTAPLLVIAVGNASRGDDALGPLLIQALRDAGVDQRGDVELLEDFQLQVEHALDLAGREAVLFVDASRVPVEGGASLTLIEPAAGDPPHSHALRPQAVLGVFERVQRAPAPAAWLLAVGGVSFELGDELSAAARIHLELGSRFASEWVLARERARRSRPAGEILSSAGPEERTQRRGPQHDLSR